MVNRPLNNGTKLYAFIGNPVCGGYLRAVQYKFYDRIFIGIVVKHGLKNVYPSSLRHQ